MNDGFLSQEEIDALLSGESSASSAAKEGEILSDIEKDAMGEIGNICMGSAATTLSILLSRRVSITTPRVSISSVTKIKQEYPLPFLVIEVGYTHGLSGSNLLAIRDQDALIIADLMMGGDGSNPPSELNELYMSAVSEAMNQMMGAVATSMSTVFRKKIDIAPPLCNLIDLGADGSIGSLENPDDSIVQVAFRMEVEDLIDSEIMQLVSISVAKDLVANLLNSVQPPQAAPAAAQPQPAAAAPQSQPQPQPAAPQPAMPYPQSMPQYAQPPLNATVQPVQFTPLTAASIPGFDGNIGLIMDVPLQITVELGRTRKLIREILDLGPGSVVELDKLAGEPVDILANSKLIAKGEVVVIDENFGVRITEIIGQLDRTTLQ